MRPSAAQRGSEGHNALCERQPSPTPVAQLATAHPRPQAERARAPPAAAPAAPRPRAPTPTCARAPAPTPTPAPTTSVRAHAKLSTSAAAAPSMGSGPSLRCVATRSWLLLWAAQALAQRTKQTWAATSWWPLSSTSSGGEKGKKNGFWSQLESNSVVSVVKFFTWRHFSC